MKSLSTPPPALSQQNRFERRADAGYMLLEMIIASAILAIAASIALGAISSSLRAGRSAENITRATLLLQETASTLRADGLPVAREGDFGGRAPGFTWTAKPVSSECAPDDFCPAEISVMWKERGQIRRSTIVSILPSKMKEYPASYIAPK